jgi:hypothetical protein
VKPASGLNAARRGAPGVHPSKESGRPCPHS